MAIADRVRAHAYPTLPGRYYYDSEIFRLEQERIFAASWVFVERADRLAAPGDYLLASVAGESIIVLRDRAGSLRAFYNVCRHRGARLCTAPEGRLRATIQCRYHAWTYGLDGHLVGAPNMRGDADFDPARNGLAPVALLDWEGLLFVNLSDQPGSLAAQGDLENPRLPRYTIGRLKAGATATYEVRANWKIVVANYYECAHCALVHPELSASLPLYGGGQVTGGLNSDGAVFAEGVEALTMSGKTNRPPLPRLTPDEHRRVFGMVVRPNVFIDMSPDFVLITRLEALAPDHTRLVMDLLFDAEVMARPDFDPSDAFAFNDLVVRQDNEVCELNQLGVTSRVLRAGGQYGINERHIGDFDRYVLTALGHADQLP